MIREEGSVWVNEGRKWEVKVEEKKLFVLWPSMNGMDIFHIPKRKVVDRHVSHDEEREHRESEEQRNSGSKWSLLFRLLIVLHNL